MSGPRGSSRALVVRTPGRDASRTGFPSSCAPATRCSRSRPAVWERSGCARLRRPRDGPDSRARMRAWARPVRHRESRAPPPTSGSVAPWGRTSLPCSCRRRSIRRENHTGRRAADQRPMPAAAREIAARLRQGRHAFQGSRRAPLLERRREVPMQQQRHSPIVPVASGRAPSAQTPRRFRWRRSARRKS